MTYRAVEIRHKEYRRHLRLERSEKLALSERSIDYQHPALFNNKENGWFLKLIRILKYKSNFDM